MPFIDTSTLEVIERLPGWYGRYFHSPSMTFAHYDFKRGSSIHEHFPQGWIYSGYKMTVFSTAEEQQREPLEIGGKVLFYPDFALRTAGGDVSVLEPWKSYVLQDRELISGQNPFSDQALLNLLLPALNRKKKLVSAA